MPGYLTKYKSIAVNGVADLHIRPLFDNQQFADPLGLAAQVGISAATWPLFGLLWPSGAKLAAHMSLRPVTLGERILEIGCGLGRASLVGHRRGADMTASDCHPLAAQFLAENLRLNDLAPMKYRHGLWGSVDVDGVAATPLAASTTENRATPHVSVPGSAPLPVAALAGHTLCNDGSVAVSGQFELIMGSDVLYESDDSGGLAHFIEAHATARTEVWIVDPHRGNRPAFNRCMAHLGFVLTEQRLDRLATLTQTAYKGRLLTYLRSVPMRA